MPVLRVLIGGQCPPYFINSEPRTPNPELKQIVVNYQLLTSILRLCLT